MVFSLLSDQARSSNEPSGRKGRPYFEQRGEIVWEVPTEQKVIAITFDDGPNPLYTPQVLRLLRQYEAKATFFLVGSHVRQFPTLTRQIVAEGNEVANHTYNHKYLNHLSNAKIVEELEQAQEEIHAATGQFPSLFRSPGGYYDERIVNLVKKCGFLMIMWSWHQDTRDWSNPGVNAIVKKVLGNVHNGDIVLFHDHGGDRTQTLEALTLILPVLKSRGYKFVTVSELLSLKNKFSTAPDSTKKNENASSDK
ncbi:polysaccharide deacetylase family protein [Brevibacillus fulvus]